MDLASRVALAVVVALAEELFFRGLLLHRLVVICRGALPAVAAQAALFSLAHVYEGPFACLVIAYLGLALGALTCWRRSLLPAIVAHALFNITQFTLLDTLVRPAP
jgi:membrane protease YdiL (CAAX protease family)